MVVADYTVNAFHENWNTSAHKEKKNLSGLTFKEHICRKWKTRAAALLKQAEKREGGYHIDNCL